MICVDSGYEIHVGGNGGIKVRATDLLAKVDTEEEVLEYAGAFMQLYREEARYLERICTLDRACRSEPTSSRASWTTLKAAGRLLRALPDIAEVRADRPVGRARRRPRLMNRR